VHGGKLVRGAVVVEGSRIGAVILDEPRAGDLPADVRDVAIVAAGFIDLQINGAFGIDLVNEPDRIGELARKRPTVGVTAFVPTLIGWDGATYRRTLGILGTRVQAPTSALQAEPLGIHLEGPLLSPTRCGAHSRALVDGAAPALLDELFAHAGVRLVTLAP